VPQQSDGAVMERRALRSNPP